MLPEHVDEALRGLNVLVVSHRTDLSGPTEALVDFLGRRVNALGFISHPFHYCLDHRSRGLLLDDGKVQLDRRLGSWPRREPFIFVKDFSLTLHFLRRFGRRFHVYMGVNPFNMLTGLWLQRFGLVDQTVLYSIDWMPRRFPQPWLNWLYHRVDRLAVSGCDVAWNLSEPIREVRAAQGKPSERNLYTPVGVDLEALQQPTKEYVMSVGRKRLVLLGALAPSKGVAAVLKAFPIVRAQHPDTELVVIGRTPVGAQEDGIPFAPYEDRLAQLKGVKLLGALPHEEVLELLPTYGISLAPYTVSATNLSNWANPSRVIDSLAAGLPVLITRVPAIADEIEACQAGIVIEDDPESLAQAIIRLIADPELYWQMRQNALALASHYDWTAIFQRALAATINTGQPVEAAAP